MESATILMLPTSVQRTGKKACQTRNKNNKNEPHKKRHLGTISKIFFTGGLHGANLFFSSDGDQDT